jgi:nitrogen fixation-related uncharacterized protein
MWEALGLVGALVLVGVFVYFQGRKNDQLDEDNTELKRVITDDNTRQQIDQSVQSNPAPAAKPLDPAVPAPAPTPGSSTGGNGAVNNLDGADGLRSTWERD